MTMARPTVASAAATAITAVGPALGDELFSTERRATVTAFSGGYLDACFVDEHDGNVVLDGIHPVARVALQPRAVVHEHDRRLAVRARKNFEEFSVERHGQGPPCGMPKTIAERVQSTLT